MRISVVIWASMGYIRSQSTVVLVLLFLSIKSEFRYFCPEPNFLFSVFLSDFSFFTLISVSFVLFGFQYPDAYLALTHFCSSPQVVASSQSSSVGMWSSSPAWLTRPLQRKRGLLDFWTVCHIACRETERERSGSSDFSSNSELPTVSSYQIILSPSLVLYWLIHSQAIYSFTSNYNILYIYLPHINSALIWLLLFLYLWVIVLISSPFPRYFNLIRFSFWD